ncbi:MAG: energy transducer TonB [Candidatus Schekmanbacteria bacterium]|nr:energy transducer TonB [Candidatus Schekmanbacteria bacterium]
MDNKTPHIITEDMTKPEPLEKVEPIYPDKARKEGIEGTVILQIVIGPTGNVEKANLLTVIPPKARGFGFEDTAIQAILKWKFSPAKDANWENVRVYYNAPIVFKLKPENQKK